MPEPAQPTELCRTVRFSINPDGSSEGHNSFSGKPSGAGLARYYEITLGAAGIPAPQTGYLIGIQAIDALVRGRLVPLIAQACRETPEVNPASLLPTLWDAASPGLEPTLTRVIWLLSPYHHIEMTTESREDNAILIRQRFEFAAAHRLHSPHMSDEENAAFFGKCNNPSGHGHNYQLEPCLRVPLPVLEEANVQLAMQRAVNDILLDKLDHKFLNTDCAWFNQETGGVIPSVENIARVCFEQLAPVIAEIGPGVKLVCVTAWETEKTSAIYPGAPHN